jgi:hypothetical protein
MEEFGEKVGRMLNEEASRATPQKDEEGQKKKLLSQGCQRGIPGGSWQLQLEGRQLHLTRRRIQHLG